MQSTSTLVLVFTLFTAATTFGNFEFNLKLLSVRLLSAVLAFLAVAIVSWEPRALESTEIIEAAPFPIARPPFLRADLFQALSFLMGVRPSFTNKT